MPLDDFAGNKQRMNAKYIPTDRNKEHNTCGNEEFMAMKLRGTTVE